MEYNIPLLFVLAAMGFLAGGINTIAGGGSNLTLPVLMLLGLPADVANGTNRVAVALQCVVGIRGFKNHDRLDVPAIMPILVPNLIGGVIGSLAAAVIPPVALKPLLLGTIILMSAIILVRPNFIAPPEGTPVIAVSESRGAWWTLLLAGVYGGFVQAGVGFILLAALAGGLRYDLVRANALKMVCSLSFTGHTVRTVFTILRQKSLAGLPMFFIERIAVQTETKILLRKVLTMAVGVSG